MVTIGIHVVRRYRCTPYGLQMCALGKGVKDYDYNNYQSQNGTKGRSNLVFPVQIKPRQWLCKPVVLL